jgi:hypothetical protein
MNYPVFGNLLCDQIKYVAGDTVAISDLEQAAVLIELGVIGEGVAPEPVTPKKGKASADPAPPIEPPPA